MELNEMDAMDRMIEEALRSEPMRAVPAGFHARMENRLQVTALVQRERQGYRFRMMATAALLAVLGFVVVGVPVIAYLQGATVQSVPGAMGYFDYLVVSAVQSWEVIAIAVGASLLVAVAAALFGVLAPYIGRHAHRQV